MDSDNIMDKIQKMIAPSDDEAKPVKKQTGPFPSRKQKNGSNRDFCESCEQAGDLICCDRCPASFHLECCEPPLSSKCIPTGKWLCNSCKTAPQTSGDEPTTCSAGPIRNSLKNLIDAVAHENPSQFELPYELMPNFPFPDFNFNGDQKEKRQAENVVAKHNLNSDSLSTKFCFQCGKSCNIAPLIECSYCPLLFHMDCLNPPLTALPVGRWMCPNHVEHVIDNRIANPNSLTDRMRLWDQYCGTPIDQETVKLDFLKRVKTSKKRDQKPDDNKLYPVIPNYIKNVYKNRPIELLPSLRDVIRYENLFGRQYSIPLSDTSLVDMELEDFNEEKTADLQINEDVNTEILAYVRPLKYQNSYALLTMNYRCLKIGSEIGSDIQLNDYGYCEFVSPKHAVIFYDQDSKSFELLNYSEFGTEVNNIVLSMDPVEKADCRKYESDRNVVQPNPRCDCKWEEKIQVGYEGSALLNHGALLKFGCLKFVFSIRQLIE